MPNTTGNRLHSIVDNNSDGTQVQRVTYTYEEMGQVVLQFDTTGDQLLVYTLVIGSERVVLEFAASGATRPAELADADLPAANGRPLPRNADELARDLRFIQMELLMSAEIDAADGERADEDEDGA